MIFWKELKIQNEATTNNSAMISFPTNGVVTFDQPVSVPTITITNPLTIPAGSSFGGSVTLPSGTSFAGPVTLPTGSSLAGSVSLSTGSTVGSALNYINDKYYRLNVAEGNIDNLQVGSLTAEQEVTLKLSADTTLGGLSIMTRGNIGGFWLDAYQGPGTNWITIRNYTTSTLNISQLQFSNHTWARQYSAGQDEAPTIAPGGTWTATDYWGWGAADTPDNIILEYTVGSNATSYKLTLTPQQWADKGGIVFGDQKAMFPGSVLSEDGYVLTVSYYSTDNTDVQLWYSYAKTRGYSDDAHYRYIGFDSNGTTIKSGAITNATTLTGPAILFFPKANN